MTYEEFLELDRYNAFENFITVTKAKQTELIPKSYNDIFKDKCACGSPNLISKNRTTVLCCNPYCKVKQAFQLAEIFSKFQLKNLGVQTCKSYIGAMSDLIQNNSVLELFLFTPEQCAEILAIEKGEEFIRASLKMKERLLSFPELISKLAIPSIDESAKELFKDINSSNELNELIQREGSVLDFLHSRGIYDKKVEFYLRTHLVDITVADYFLESVIRTAGLCRIQLVLTGSMQLDKKPVTQAGLIDYYNKISVASNGVQLFEFENCKARKSTNYIICSEVSDSESYKVGRERGVLYTPEEFREKLRGVLKSYETRIRGN